MTSNSSAPGPDGIGWAVLKHLALTERGMEGRRFLNSYHNHLLLFPRSNQCKNSYSMSSMPPRKGKKRPAPQTPTGKPPVKASRPSTPTASTSEHPLALEAERLRRQNPGVTPAIPPFRPRSEVPQAPPTPTGETSAVPMDTDRASSPVLDSHLAFTTVDAEIDDDEAESSFKELLDWMRYLAQHRGQRARLLDFTSVAAASLQDLMGLEEERQPVSYAAVAATSAAPKPRSPKKATSAPTPKHIQHAITRYERVSRELPGAPRDTLLKVVANSDLKSAPAPIPDRPKPRKRPA
jgi:hypothetical protein